VEKGVCGGRSSSPQPYEGRYYSRLTDQDRCIRWDRPAGAVLDQIRACYFPPYLSSHTYFRGQRHPVWRAALAPGAAARQPGSVLGFDEADRPVIAAAEGGVLLCESELYRPYLAVGDLLTGPEAGGLSPERKAS
jgi:methionyl-tRNA formyltransferase